MIKGKYSIYDGNSWEEFCQICLKLKFESEGYQELPAWQGDMGIEGFTRTGKVFQCYCPDDDYDPSTLYEKQRDKISKDLAKLEKNLTELKDYLKEVKIAAWIFLTPYYKNKELVKHCQNKALEYRAKELEILSHDFDVLIYDEDFFVEQARIALGINGNKIEIRVDTSNDVDWKDSNIALVENAFGKHLKRLSSTTKDKDIKINKLTDRTVGDFLAEQSILKKWKELFPDEYEKFLRIISDYEDTVEEMCIVNTDDNNKLYDTIKDELKKRIGNAFRTLDDLTIEKLTKGVLADWLLRCPINFE